MHMTCNNDYLFFHNMIAYTLLIMGIQWRLIQSCVKCADGYFHASSNTILRIGNVQRFQYISYEVFGRAKHQLNLTEINKNIFLLHTFSCSFI